MTAQGEGVFVAGGQVANAKHADQSFEFVGQGHHQAHGVARQLVAGKARFVVVFDGLGHGVAQAIVAGVVAAHDALQLGEFADHVGEQIGLGQLGGGVDLAGEVDGVKLQVGRALTGRVFGGLARRLGLGRQQQGGDATGDGAHTLGALALGAKFVVVDHFAQAFDALGE